MGVPLNFTHFVLGIPRPPRCHSAPPAARAAAISSGRAGGNAWHDGSCSSAESPGHVEKNADLGISIVMELPSLDGLFQGKCHLDMDDDWEYPISGNLHLMRENAD